MIVVIRVGGGERTDAGADGCIFGEGVAGQRDVRGGSRDNADGERFRVSQSCVSQWFGWSIHR